jgi:hypothetical protein
MAARIFAYCERGFDPGLFAEPLNLASNAAFFIAAAMALRAWRADNLRGRAELALIALVTAIGIGSTLFHAAPTPVTRLADVIPIGAFMVGYLAYALRRFLSLGTVTTLAGVAVFIAALFAMGTLRCSGRPCLSGSVGYLPALGALLVVGVALHWRGHPAARYVLAAAGLLALSLTLRTLDRSLCPWTIVSGRALGTHALWHILNGVVLGALLMAAVRLGGRPNALRR